MTLENTFPSFANLLYLLSFSSIPVKYAIDQPFLGWSFKVLNSIAGSQIKYTTSLLPFTKPMNSLQCRSLA